MPTYDNNGRPIETSWQSTPALWAAYFKDEYCGCGECHPLHGYGKTEAEAMADLEEHRADREDEDDS